MYLFFIVLIMTLSYVDMHENKYIRYGKNGETKGRLCELNAAYYCLVGKHFDTECMTALNIIYGVDSQSMKLDSEDSHREAFTSCIYQKIKPLTKDPKISHDMYFTQEEIESVKEAKKFDDIYKQLSKSTSLIDKFKYCRFEKIVKCFLEQECIMKSYHTTLLNIFDHCKNESVKSDDVKIDVSTTTLQVPTLFPPPTSTSTSNEKEELLAVIGQYSMTAIGNLKRYAELDDDFRNYFCSK